MCEAVRGIGGTPLHGGARKVGIDPHTESVLQIEASQQAFGRASWGIYETDCSIGCRCAEGSEIKHFTTMRS